MAQQQKRNRGRLVDQGMVKLLADEAGHTRESLAAATRMTGKTLQRFFNGGPNDSSTLELVGDELGFDISREAIVPIDPRSEEYKLYCYILDDIGDDCIRAQHRDDILTYIQNSEDARYRYLRLSTADRIQLLHAMQHRGHLWKSKSGKFGVNRPTLDEVLLALDLRAGTEVCLANYALRMSPIVQASILRAMDNCLVKAEQSLKTQPELYPDIDVQFHLAWADRFHSAREAMAVQIKCAQRAVERMMWQAGDKLRRHRQIPAFTKMLREIQAIRDEFEVECRQKSARLEQSIRNHVEHTKSIVKESMDEIRQKARAGRRSATKNL